MHLQVRPALLADDIEVRFTDSRGTNSAPFLSDHALGSVPPTSTSISHLYERPQTGYQNRMRFGPERSRNRLPMHFLLGKEDQ